jgi:signal transduction histidine kinase
MSSSESRLFCRLDGLSAVAREQQRLLALADLGLLEADSIPVFEEATQTAAQFLEAPICWLGVMDRDNLWFKASLGLSKLGLMNTLAKTRRVPRDESFCTHVVDSQQVLAIPNTALHPAFAHGLLSQQYGICSYLGAPLVTSSGHCLGTLAVVDLESRVFSDKDMQSLELIARWCVSEFERDRATSFQQMGQQIGQQMGQLDRAEGNMTRPDRLSDRSSDRSKGTWQSEVTAPEPIAPVATPNPLRLQLVGQLTQQLRAPLTAVLGMAGMLNREIYGPLTEKQREYLDVIQRSGQSLLSLIQEIMDLASLEDGESGLNMTPVDVELLCQQVVHGLAPIGQQRDLELRFSVEPGHRIWHLDKDKVRQMLYHLMCSIIQSANAESILRLHVSRKRNQLQFSLWVSHPWLGDGLPPTDGSAELGLIPVVTSESELTLEDGRVAVGTMRRSAVGQQLTSQNMAELLAASSTERPENLRLLLSRHLAEIQGGQLFVQSSLESGYRYIALLPVSGLGD